MQRFILTAALFTGLTFSQNLTQIQDLPPCGQTCLNNMLGRATSLGCLTTDYLCLCSSMNFGYGVRDCSISLCAAANPPVDPAMIISVGNDFCSEVNAVNETGNPQTAAVSGGAVASGTGTAAGSSFGSATTSTPALASATISIPTFQSSTTLTANPPSASASFPSSTTLTANPPSASASQGLSPSAKVGIGLGVPLCVIVLAITGFLTQRYRKHTENSRLRHHGNIAAAGLYPAIDEGEKSREKEDEKNKVDVESSSEARGLKKNDDIHEIQGNDVPACSRELRGSLGVQRQELPTRRGSA